MKRHVLIALPLVLLAGCANNAQLDQMSNKLDRLSNQVSQLSNEVNDLKTDQKKQNKAIAATKMKVDEVNQRVDNMVATFKK